MNQTMTMGVATESSRAGALTESLQTFARVRNGTLRIVAGLSEDQAAFRPRQDVWSVAQILDHLLLTEALYRTQMQHSHLSGYSNQKTPRYFYSDFFDNSK